MRQPRRRYRKPASDIAMPNVMPIETRPSSPIQRLSNAYFRKNAVAKRISTIATQPTPRRPISDSSSKAFSAEVLRGGGGGSGAIGGGGGGVTGSGLSGGGGSGRGSRPGSTTTGGRPASAASSAAILLLVF